MDVAKEFKEVDFRVKMNIRRNALIAEAKIYDMTPEDYAAQLDEAQRLATLQAYRTSAYQFGLAVGELQRIWAESVEQVAAGIRAALGR